MCVNDLHLNPPFSRTFLAVKILDLKLDDSRHCKPSTLRLYHLIGIDRMQKYKLTENTLKKYKCNISILKKNFIKYIVLTMYKL